MRIVSSIAAVALLLAAPVVAEEMMPPGPSPETGFAGVWRIIDAKPGPWAKPRRLTRAEAPLLEYAVDFADHEVKGPAPLACKAATYSSGVTPRMEVFGGRLENDASGAIARSLKLSQPSTYRVICGGAARDYYFNDEADLVMAQGDVVYTLERPTGMDAEQYQPGYSGPSFDCASATTTGDRLICIDAGLSRSDRRLGGAWRALEKAESAASFATFRTAQRAWLAHVMKSCGATGPMPDNIGDTNSMIDCLDTAYGDRAALFADLKMARAGLLVLEPRMRFRTRVHPDTEESDIYPWMSGGPPAAAFNAFIATALKLDRWRMDDTVLFRYGKDDFGMKLYARRSYTVARFDGRVVSLEISTSDFVGGHDEERDDTTLNWRMPREAPPPTTTSPPGARPGTR